MQVKCWLGFKQAGRTDVHQLTFPSRRLVAAVLVPLGLAFSAWEVGHSYERMADGSIQYLDQLSAVEKAEARDRIVRTLNRGLETYELQIGDEFEYSIPRLRPAARLVADRF